MSTPDGVHGGPGPRCHCGIMHPEKRRNPGTGGLEKSRVSILGSGTAPCAVSIRPTAGNSRSLTPVRAKPRDRVRDDTTFSCHSCLVGLFGVGAAALRHYQLGPAGAGP